jgi:purine-nucleoside phosphorylase
MEASALYTVSHYKKVHIASIFYIADEYKNEQWLPKSKEKTTRNAILKINRFIFNNIRNLNSATEPK